MLNKIFCLLLIGLSFSSCKDGKSSINDLYKFVGAGGVETKDVSVHVQIDYKLDQANGPTLNASEQKFILNAFVFSGSEQKVSIGRDGAAPLENLPVTLTGSHLEFDAVLRMASTVQPGPNGYAFHFSLLEPVATLAGESSTTIKNLEALKGGVQPGALPGANVVPLSLATTFAYRMTTSADVDDGSTTHVSVYESIASKIAVSLKAIEAKLDPSKATDLGTLSSALASALKLEVATNQGLQSDLVGLIEPSAIAKFGADKAASTLAASFTAFVKTLLSEASAVLTPAGAEEPSLFKAGAIDTAAIPNPDTYVSVIYAPRAISFTDTDTSSSLGGLITITAPQVKSGIISYNLYFGGSTLASAKGMLIGNVLSSVEPLSYTLDSGTVLPSGSTHLWVYPVTSGGELPLATSSQITNVLMQIPGMVTTLTATGFNGRIDLSWTAVAGATSYKIYYSNGSTVTTSNSSLTAIINPYSHFGTTNFLQYNYRIAAVNASGEGPLSTVSASATGSGVHASWVGLLVASPEELAVPWSTDPRAGSFSTAGDEAIRKASSIALDEEGDVMYVVNTNGQRVTKRKISDGSVLGSIGKVNAVSTGTCPSSGVTPGWCTGGSFGSSTQDGGFDYPSSVVIDKGRDSMWIGNNQHISKYTLSTGAFVGSVGGVYAAIGGSTCPAAGGVAQSWCTGAEFRNSSPLKDGEFEGVSDMKLDTVSGTLYVTDYSNRVVKMNAVTGAFIGAIGKITTLNPGSTCVTGYRDNVAATGWCTGGEFEYGDWDGEFDEPCAIAIDQPGNRIYVSTCSGDAISRIDMTTGAFLGKIGASDGLGADSDCQLSPDDAVLGWCKDFEPSDDDNDLDGGFYEPEAIAVDLDNDKLYVGHYYDNKVCQHTLSTGAFIGCQGNNSNGVGGYAATQSWLTDTNMNRADSSGSYLGGFEEVDSIISGRDGYLYIGDANNRILRFSKQ